MLLDRLFHPAIQTSESDVRLAAPELLAEESRYMSGAVDRRRREFAAGRSCARQAMARLGQAAVAVPVGPDRAPVWPEGIVGSISHSETRCGAALALKSDGFRAVGLDIEEAAPLDEAFTDEICIESEANWLARQPSGARGLLLKALFSAKECTYKCQYPLSGALFDFQAIRIDLQIAAGHFLAEFRIDAGPFRAGDRLTGRIRHTGDYLVAAMAID